MNTDLVDVGEWGAWRSILGSAIELAAELDEIWAGILARERGED